MKYFLLILIVALPGAAARAQTGGDAFVGVFTGQGITLTLEREGEGYTGQVAAEGQRYPVKAQVKGGAVLQGTYTYQGQALPFMAVRQGSALEVVSQDGRFVLQVTDAASADGARAAEQDGAATSAEAREWAEWLQGCRLSYFNSYDSGYGGGGYIDETVIDLCPGYFHHSANSETVFNARDLSGSDRSLSSSEQGAGQWQVISAEGQLGLQLRFHDGTVQTYRLGYEDGKTFLNGKRYLRTCNPNDSVVEARPRCF